MYIRKAILRHTIGLHGRTAVGFVQLANTFQSVVKVQKDVPNARVASAKSLMDVMSLDVVRDAMVILSANGPDEADAADALVHYLENPPEKSH